VHDEIDSGDESLDLTSGDISESQNTRERFPN
jgi:hypothetical protein